MKTFLFSVCLFSLAEACFAGTETVNGITWSYRVLPDGSAGVGTGYIEDSPAISSSTEGEVVIPERLGGKPVTSINNWAFWKCSKVTKFTIPDSVTNIGESSFEDC